MERDKTKLEQSFIATSEGVYEKTKNLSLFVANNATFRQRFWFVMSGVRYATLRFTVAILLHGKEKGKLIRALVKGVNEGAKGFGKRK